jgi:hypothetical protein
VKEANFVAITSYPFDNQDTSESQFSQLFRELQDSGVADSNAGPGFAVTANASGMHVMVHAGFALLRGHAVLSTATETVPLAQAAAFTRTDRIVLRLDPTANNITLTVIEGIPGSGLPALTQTDTGVFETPLAQVTVTAGAASIAADQVTDERRYVGSRVGAWSNATRPTDARTGRLGLNVTTRKWEFFDGNTWTDLAPVVNWATIAGKPTIFPAAGHRHPWNELDDVPGSFTPSWHTHDWNQIDGKPGSFPPAAHGHSWGEINWRPTTFPPQEHSHNYAAANHSHGYAAANHSHGAPNTVNRANGSDRVHGHSPAGSGWYAVWCDGNRNFCHNTSSIRFKTNVRDYAIDPAGVLALRPVVYDRKATWNEDTGSWQDGQTNEWGLIAEDVHEHVPELVQWMDHDDGNGPVIEAVRYDLLGVALLPVVQDQAARAAALEAQVAGLHKALQAVLARDAP